jgi:hypothetical protein
MPSRDPLLVPFSVERLRVSREHEGLAYGSVRWFAKVQLIVSNYKEYTAPAWNEMISGWGMASSFDAFVVQASMGWAFGGFV